MKVHIITHVKWSDRTVRIASARLTDEKNYFRITVRKTDGQLLFPGLYVIPKVNKYSVGLINDGNLKGIKIPFAEMKLYAEKTFKEEKVGKQEQITFA